MSSTPGGATMTCQLAIRGGQSYHSDSGTPGSRSPLRAPGGSRQDIPSSDGLSECELQCDLVASTVRQSTTTGVKVVSHERSRAGLGGCSSGAGRGGGGGGSLTRIRVQFFDDDVKKLVDVEQL